MPRKTRSKKKRSGKLWSLMSPKTKRSRKSIKSRCGSKCFMDSKNLKYPICSPWSCKPNCKGIRAAYSRARQYHHNSIASRAYSRSKKYCK